MDITQQAAFHKLNLPPLMDADMDKVVAASVIHQMFLQNAEYDDKAFVGCTYDPDDPRVVQVCASMFSFQFEDTNVQPMMAALQLAERAQIVAHDGRVLMVVSFRC